MKKSTILLGLIFCSVSIYAQDTISKLPWNNIELNVGGYLTDITTEAKIGSNSFGLGVQVDFEKAFGLKSSSFVFQANGLLRFGKKKKSFTRLGYYGIVRKSSKTLETEIDLFDKTYAVGTTISSEITFNIINLSYGYSFFQTENFDVGATFGFFIMPITFSLDAVNINSTVTASSDAVSFIAPLPVIGLYTNFAFTPKLIMRQNVSLFYIAIANFKGSLTELNMSLEYKAWKNVGFGIGINTFSLNVEVANKTPEPFDFKGEFGYKLSGALFYVKGYF